MLTAPGCNKTALLRLGWLDSAERTRRKAATVFISAVNQGLF